jgi:dienelactone hydrolase
MTFDLRDAEAFAQAVAEIRALTDWLLGQGCPSVALFGISLGGWFAGLVATRDSRLNAVVMAVPGVRRDYRATRGERILWKSADILRRFNRGWVKFCKEFRLVSDSSTRHTERRIWRIPAD